MFETVCPDCGGKSVAMNSAIGSEMICGSCHQPFVVSENAPPANQPVTLSAVGYLAFTAFCLLVTIAGIWFVFKMNREEKREKAEQIARVEELRAEDDEAAAAAKRANRPRSQNRSIEFVLSPEQKASIIENIMALGATDVAISKSDDSINLAFGVTYGTTKDQAKAIGENFVRLTMALSNDENPGKDLVKGNFSYLVGAFTPDEKWLVMGHKRSTQPKTTW